MDVLFKGSIVHAQFWDESHDYSGKRVVRKLLLRAVQRQLEPNVSMRHFTPDYNPWDERLCVVPNGDLFKVLNSDRASIVTDRHRPSIPERDRGDLSTGSEFACRLLNHMDRHGYAQVTPRNSEGFVTDEPFVALKSGYLHRGGSVMPPQGSRAPWRNSQNVFLDTLLLRHGTLDDGYLRFTRVPREAAVHRAPQPLALAARS